MSIITTVGSPVLFPTTWQMDPHVEQLFQWTPIEPLFWGFSFRHKSLKNITADMGKDSAKRGNVTNNHKSLTGLTLGHPSSLHREL